MPRIASKKVKSKQKDVMTKIKTHVYNKLVSMRKGDESISQVIERCLLMLKGGVTDVPESCNEDK